MFTKIYNLINVVYNGETNELIGSATLDLTPEAEKALLDLVNNGIKPSSLTVLNVNLYQPTESYIPPTDPYKSYSRLGNIHASVIDSVSGESIPVRIQFKFKLRARGVPIGNLYYFNSAIYDDIEIESVNFRY